MLTIEILLFNVQNLGSGNYIGIVKLRISCILLNQGLM